MFTTPCFIRKNTPELRCKLEELGYESLMCDETEDCVLYTKLTHKGAFYVGTFYINERHPQCPFNCGDNENLFLAIAALRDDSDHLQWFVCGEDGDSCFLCGDKDVKNYIHNHMDGWDCSDYHKASLEELINHFKK